MHTTKFNESNDVNIPQQCSVWWNNSFSLCWNYYINKPHNSECAGKHSHINYNTMLNQTGAQCKIQCSKQPEKMHIQHYPSTKPSYSHLLKQHPANEMGLLVWQQSPHRVRVIQLHVYTHLAHLYMVKCHDSAVFPCSLWVNVVMPIRCSTNNQQKLKNTHKDTNATTETN